ncbi:MAG TPA: hypothetical protein VND64_11865 [Pirellulales bacterium]|nr:hypothetical protein [Pirellulales bacterium]
MNQPEQPKLGWGPRAVVAALALATVAYLKWWPTAPRPEPPTLDADASAQLDGLRDKASRLQAEGKWKEAQDAWDKLLEESPADADDTNDALRDEARRNLRIAERNAHPETPPVAELKLPEPPAAKRPTKVSKGDVAEFYPVGRTVRSIAYFHANGKGSNTAWVFKSDASFDYEYRVVVETKVKENRGTAVVFEQHFKTVDELRAVSDRELEFHFPDSPILKVVWEQLDETLLPLHAAYRVLKKVKQLAGAVDPRGRRALTRFNRFLSERGQGIGDDHLELVERIRDLSGQRLEIEYVSGLGVTYIKVLDGRRLDPDLLDRVAHGSSAFMDYFIAEGAKRGAGEVFTLSSQDVGGLFNFGDEIRAIGTIDLKQSSTGERAGGQPTVLEIIGGDIEIEAPEEGAEQRLKIEPIKGTVDFSEEARLVTRARASWRAESLWATTDHLLFGTTSIHDLSIETYYEAELAPIADGDGAK